MPEVFNSKVKNLLTDFQSQVKKVLGENLAGIYLYGSLTWGDFDKEVSDIDLLIVLITELKTKEIQALKSMHESLVKKHKNWEDRIDVQYLSKKGLKNFRTKTSQMVRIAPGDPFQVINAGMDWIMNWYFVLDNGVTLMGPAANKFIDPISNQEFYQAIKDHVKWWKKHLPMTKKNRPYQSYAILTMCRALYSIKNKGVQVSKIKAAKWVKNQLPEYAKLIEKALLWRQNVKEKVKHELTYPKTRKFVLKLIDQIEKAD